MDNTIIKAALMWAEHLRKQVDSIDAAVNSVIKAAAVQEAKPKRAYKKRGAKRELSDEGRKRIAEAQKRRWAEKRAEG